MTEESDLFCMLPSACRGMTACFRLRTEAAAAGNDCPHEKISSTAFFYCSEGLKCVIIRNKLLRTDLFQGGREVLFLIRPSGRFMWKEWREHMAIKKRMVGIVGVGHVGAHVAFNLGMMGIADEVLLCDLKESKVTSEVQDLNDAVMYMPNHVVYKASDYAGLKNCDVIVNAVGDITLCASGSRDGELENSVKQVADYVPKVMAAGFHGLFVSITNPCDVVANLIARKSGLPKGHVMGTGTLLDSSRLIHAISEQTGLDSRGFTAFMLGEHGNSQIVPWSQITFYGKPLSEMESDPKFRFDKEEVQERTIKGGWVTYSGKQCTEYGIASAGATLVRTILHDEKRILPCSAPLDGEYGESSIFCGVPAVIGANGVEKVIEYNLTEEELARFKACCATIRANIAKGDAILGE